MDVLRASRPLPFTWMKAIAVGAEIVPGSSIRVEKRADGSRCTERYWHTPLVGDPLDQFVKGRSELRYTLVGFARSRSFFRLDTARACGCSTRSREDFLLVDAESNCRGTDELRRFEDEAYKIYWRGFFYTAGSPAGLASITKLAADLRANNLQQLAVHFRGVFMLLVEDERLDALCARRQ